MESEEVGGPSVFGAQWWISVAAAAIILLLLFKAKGGLLGLILGVVAVAVLVYWLVEVRRQAKGSRMGARAGEFNNLV